jgi:hypothetical protein
MNISIVNQTPENLSTGAEQHSVEDMDTRDTILVKQLLIHFPMCLLSTLLACIHYMYNTREIPLIRRTALTVCSSYLIMIISSQVWINFLPNFMRLIVGSTGVLVAQLMEILLIGNGCSICAMGSAIALLKMLTVSYFDWMYNQGCTVSLILPRNVLLFKTYLNIPYIYFLTYPSKRSLY